VLALNLGQKYRATDQPDWQTTMTNLYLNETEYQLLSTLEGRLLIKKRYPYHHTGRDYSVDVFEGPLTGLILLETEGRSIDDLLCIPIPAFAVREVTDDQSFTGGALVKLSPEEFQQWQASWPDER
jgi:CYTH domain-containing protein